ncbi:N-6 DNA methylase [Streptomyces poonensis]|uniref:Type II restriction endonuclease subunit M n=1 Tax=Streptomyces poonensis TaxID=68255 RepID=A0A918Q0Y5_9ACTN|nr:N-6 DNA methylase [Streptomyces poonensis]GGZ28016.1 type II restriction endonuclease subunit M [Streptomyces poonensis]GLJ89774.1 type II restriction endonuclease subunit M [Streptomyces poonensis]
MTTTSAVPVSLAEIARIAGVGRAAVSNWRRRHDSFPSRIGGTDVSPQFSLAEVEQWLRDNGKLKDVGGRELLWPRFEALGSRDESGLAIAEAARRMRSPRARVSQPELSGAARELVGEAARLGRAEGSRETFEFLLQRWLETHVRQLSTTPPPLATLMTRIALAVRLGGTDQRELTVLDPACGTGHLAAAALQEYDGPGLTVLACERDPALAALAAARLGFLTEDRGVRAEITTADALRDDSFAGSGADIALCNPPFNERDWGYEELATDQRWTHGLPPRTEPELAWVQHLLAHLKPGGTAVVVLPPAVASRKAGRRIRGSLLRTGALRAVVALPPGSAQPHSVSLQLWVLRAAPDGSAAAPPGQDALLVDATGFAKPGAREPGPDWDALGSFVLTAVQALDHPDRELPGSAVRVPLLDLLDDEVDVTPGRYTANSTEASGAELAASWEHLRTHLAELTDHVRYLSGLGFESGTAQTTATVGDLLKAGALTLRAGQQPTETAVAPREPTVPLLTVPDLLMDGTPSGTAPAGSAPAVVEEGDVVVAGVVRAFKAWVHSGPPLALGPQLYALRVDREKLDAHFLAGCLRAPANGRQAGTHASSSSRVDIRRLHVLQLPLAEQAAYAEAFRRLRAFETLLTRIDGSGRGLVDDVGDRLAAGGLTA